MVEEKKAEQKVEEPSAPIVDIASLQAQLAAKEVELEQTKKGLSTAHQTLTQKDRELKNQSDLRGEIASIREDLELAVTAFAGRQSGEDAPDNKVIQDTLTELTKKRNARDASRRAEDAGNILSAYQQRVAALGLTEDDEAYWDIYRTARTLDPVDLKLADIKLKKLEAVKTGVKEKHEVDIQKAIADGIQSELKRRGLLDTDVGSPSGGRLSASEAMAKYSKGEISAEEAKKQGVNFD